ncbi:hypothetical protein ACJ41O_008439 [Fusarium nematophilum]
MATASEMMKLMWKPPRTEPGVKRWALDRKLPENFKYYGNWGFTIYRTYYSPESDEHWEMLLDSLKRQTMLALGYCESEDQYTFDLKRREYHYGSRYYQSEDEYRVDLEQLKKLFHLDPREDASLLGGLDVRQLREVCLSEPPNEQKTMAGKIFRYVLVADESVLKDIAEGEFVVKAVAYNWKEHDDY